MKKYIGIAAALTLAAHICAGPAAAQAVRTFVSGHGSDTGTCGVGSPCRTFAYAITQTSAGGEIAVLDTAGYGTLSINKAINVIAPDGVEGGITVNTSGVDAIAVAAGSTDSVNLRGLTLTGSGVANDGINFTSGANLNVQNCVIRNFNNEGIAISPVANSNVSVLDTLATGNVDGISVNPTGSSIRVTATLHRVESIGNQASGVIVLGANATGTVNVTAADSLASGNGPLNLPFGIGFEVSSVSGKAIATFTVTNSRSLNNGATGVSSNGTNAILVLSQTTIAGNPQGYLIQSGGIAYSFDNNQIYDPGNNGSLTFLGPS